MTKKVLITGATGLVGTRLTDLLLQKGYQVSHLGRSKRLGKVPSYSWDIEKGTVDPQALADEDVIIHLAGAGVADKRWTNARKQEILESRIKSSALLYQCLATSPHSVKAVISASAIGYYGFGIGDEVLNEEASPGADFLAQVTQQWESEVDKITVLNIRVVKLRIGIVLSAKGGALVEMAKPIRWGVGAPLGTGQQYLSWIHLDDLCNMFIKAVENEAMKGAFNAVSGHWVTNQELTRMIAKIIRRPLWLPNIPAFVLKLLIGEMAGMVLNGSKISADKIKQTGVEVTYPNLEEALKDLLSKTK
jgi:uncharacterized protein